MIETTDIAYPGEGVSIPGRLYRPASSKPEAAGVLLCAGRFRDIAGLEFIAMALAGQGCVVVATQYRGMDFFTDDADVRAGLDYLAGCIPGNPARLGVVGHSRGGMAALRAAALDPRVRTVVALAAPTDLTSYIRAMELLSPARYAGLVLSMGGPPDAQPDRYRQLSALSYADRIKVPVLLVCGNQDLHAPLDHSQWMLDALRRAGNSRCRLEVLDGVGHFFERMYFGYEFDQVAALTTDWLRETLPLPN